MKVNSLLASALSCLCMLAVSCGENEIPQVGPGTPTDPVTGTYFAESFGTAGSLGDFTIDNVNLGGVDKIWFSETYGTTTYAKGSTMKSSGFVECEAWLVSPEIDLSKAETAAVTFEHAHRFAGKPDEELTVWIKKSSDSAWSEKLDIAYSDQSNWNMVTTSSDISSYAGKKVKIGFCYKGTKDNNAGWEICNFSVTATATPSLTLLDPSLKVQVGGTVEINYTTTSPATIEFSSDNAAVATVDASGIVTGVSEGTATITVKSPAFRSFKEVSKTIVVEVQSEPIIDFISIPFNYSAAGVAKDAAIGSIELPSGMSYDKNSSADNYKCYKDYLGMRASGTAFIFKTGEAFGKVEITSKGNGSDGVYNGTLIFEGSVDGNDYTSIKEAVLKNNAKDSTYSAVNTNEAYRYLRLRYQKTTGNLGLKSVTITAPGALDPCVKPGITLYRNVVTLTCAQEGASIYYTTDGSDPTAASTRYTEPFAITSDVTVKAVAIADGYALSPVETLSCDFVEDLPDEITTVAALVASITSTDKDNPTTFAANLTDLVFTGFSSNNRFAEDATGGVLFYMYNDQFSYKVGDKFTGTITGSGYIYNGLPEITVADFSAATKSTAETLPLTTVTLADLLKDYDVYMHRRIKIEGVTVSKAIAPGSTGEISVGDVKADIRGTGSVNVSEGSKGNVICFPTLYSGNIQISIIDQEDFQATETAGKITLVPTKSVQMGQTLQLDATVNSGAAISWSSSDTAIATVDATGLVTPVAVGEVEIKAAVPAAEKDGVKYSAAEAVCKVTVKEAGSSAGEGSFTWDLTKATFDADQIGTSKVVWTSDNVTMTLAKGSSSSPANNYIGGSTSNGNTCAHTRVYKDQILTFSPESGVTITSIEIVATDATYASKWENTWTNGTFASNGANVTITPSDGTKDVVFTVAAATRATSITVNYEIK